MKITQKAVVLFEFALSSASWTPADACAALGLRAGEINDLLCELRQLNLLSRNPQSDSGWEVVSPRRAASTALAAEQQEIMRRQSEMAQLQETFGALESAYQETCASRHQRTSSCYVERSRTALVVLADMMPLARAEFRVAYISTKLSQWTLSSTLENDLAALRRGVHVKVLLQHTTRSHLGIRKWATALVEAGALVRTVTAVPARIAILDDSCAIVPHEQSDAETSVVHEPGLVQHLLSSFEASWCTSKDYPVGLSPNELVSEPTMRVEVRKNVLELLAQGATDDTVARRLQVSSRTARRHVADVMREIGAASRFQAGILVEREGLLDLAPP